MSIEALVSGPDRPAGALLAGAVGDALGWPQEDRSRIVGGETARRIEPAAEFRDWLRHGGTRYAGYLDPVQAGQYSDDTQLTLAVARACLRGHGWWSWLTEVELPWWPTYERGGGGAVLRAARSWARGHPPWVAGTAKTDGSALSRYYEAGGNGVAMRIAAHAIIAEPMNLSPRALATRVVRDGSSTHGHPHALVGAALHAVSLAGALTKSGTLGYGELLERALDDRVWTDPALLMDATDPDWHDGYWSAHPKGRGKDPLTEWNRVAHETVAALTTAREALDRGTLVNDQNTLTALGCFDDSRKGAGTVAAVAALYVASRSATRPMSGLLRTAFLHGADTDTIASITGTLLGALHGTSWLGPMGREVQDRHHVLELAWRLSSSVTHEEPPTNRDAKVNESVLRRWTYALQNGNVSRLPDARDGAVVAVFDLEQKSSTLFRRYVCETSDGQTLFFDKGSRPRSGTRSALTESSQQPLFLAEESSKAASDERGESMPAVEQKEAPSEVLAIELRVTDIETSVRFYGKLLGLRLERAGGQAIFENGLYLTQLRDPKSGTPTRGFVVTVRHADVHALADRIATGDGQATWSNDKASLWLKDPDGNSVRVMQAR